MFFFKCKSPLKHLWGNSIVQRITHIASNAESHHVDLRMDRQTRQCPKTTDSCRLAVAGIQYFPQISKDLHITSDVVAHHFRCGIQFTQDAALVSLENINCHSLTKYPLRGFFETMRPRKQITRRHSLISLRCSILPGVLTRSTLAAEQMRLNCCEECSKPYLYVYHSTLHIWIAMQLR